MTEGGRWAALCHRFIVQPDTQIGGEDRLGHTLHPAHQIQAIGTALSGLGYGVDRRPLHGVLAR